MIMSSEQEYLEKKALVVISINSLIGRLNNVKSTMNDEKLVISKLNWDDTKILFDKEYTKRIDEFFNNLSNNK
jgi:hypothetical protein